MGSHSSKPVGAEPLLFSDDEVLHFKALLNTINGSHDTACVSHEFKKWCENTLDDWLAGRLTYNFSIVDCDGERERSIISHSKFLSFFSKIFKGSLADQVECIFELSTTDFSAKETITEEEILTYTQSLVRSYIKSASKTRRFQSWKGCTEMTLETVTQLSEFLLSHVLYLGLEPKESFSRAQSEKLLIGLDDLVDGLTKENQLLLDIQASVFSHCFNFEENGYLLKLIPACLKAKRPLLPDPFTLLDFPRIIFLNSQLPPEFRREWRYLFSSGADGESFSILMSAIQHQGATVIIVKDTDGRIFGGFADECWTVGPKFHGTHKCFLFHLYPKMLVYPSTGFNENFQYLNIHQLTMPNGLGMGGKLEYFGLWLDSEYGKGKCAPSCTTFDAPQLSQKEDFVIEAVEVWGVGPEPTEEEILQRKLERRTSLDVDPETRAILELVGRSPVSDGYRDDVTKSYEEINNED